MATRRILSLPLMGLLTSFWRSTRSGLIGSESTASLNVSISTDAIGEQDAGEIDGFAHQFQASHSVSGSLLGGVDILWSLGSSGQAEFVGDLGLNNALTGTLHVSDQGNDATLSLNIPLTVAGQTAPANEELLLQDIKAFIDFNHANLGIKDLCDGACPRIRRARNYGKTLADVLGQRGL